MAEFAVRRPRALVRPLPKVSFGPYGLLDAVPWLMLASAMRFVAFSQPALALPCYMLSNLAIFLAFLLATLWSAFLAALVLLMVIGAGEGGTIKLAATWREFSQRALYLVPAILLLAGLLMGLSEIQGAVRGFVRVFDNTSTAPRSIKNLVYFFFVFGFASLRLWVSLAVLVLALRESYRRTPA